MEILIMNPAFPHDKKKAKALTAEQFEVVHDFIVECMNKRKRIKDEVILERLANAGNLEY